ncbi:MAG: Hsp20/alpha crystallin family protein [Acidobacteria bacterium]|nr:Hsp20/alpha crystallin family protein [Acidobacteriota bacterium]
MKSDDPLRDLFELQEKMHRLLVDAFLHAGDTDEVAGVWSPPMDVYETNDAIVLIAELPGLARDDVEIRIDQNSLVLQGERKFSKDVKEENYHRIERHFGAFSRTLALPPAVDTEAVKAELRNGVLEITLPKTNQLREGAIDVPIG